MKFISISKLLAVFVLFATLGLAITTHAQSYYYGTSTSYPPVWSDLGPSYDRFASGCYQDCSYSPSPYYQSWNNNFYYSNTSTRDIWVYPRLNYQPYYSSYYPSTTYYPTYSYADVSTNDDSDDEPRVTTSSVTTIGDDKATLRGSVDMGDFHNGIVFFVYGQDEDAIDDVDDDYDSYADVDDDEEENDFMIIRVDNDLDDDDSYNEEVDELEAGETYYVRLCVEYDDDDDDKVLMCGSTRDFETDN